MKRLRPPIFGESFSLTRLPIDWEFKEPVAVATSQYLLLLLAILKPPGRLKLPEEEEEFVKEIFLDKNEK